MNTIQNLFQQAELAEATYADFSLARPVKVALTDTATGGGFSASQADDFIKHWRVVSQQPDTLTGFSATVFQNKDTQLLGTEPN